MRPTHSRCLSVVCGAWLICLFAFGCDSSSPAECRALSSECLATAPSFSKDIFPIFGARCQSCHDPDDPSGPWPFDTHADISDWRESILDELDSCGMPPPDSGVHLPESERELLHAWLVCGAPDN